MKTSSEVNFEKRGKLTDHQTCSICGACLCDKHTHHARLLKMFFWLLYIAFVLGSLKTLAFGAEIPYNYQITAQDGLQDINVHGAMVAEINNPNLKALVLSQKKKIAPVTFGCLGPVDLDDTQVRRLNNKGDIAGSCVNKLRPDPTAEIIGFLRDRQGNLTFIKPPTSVGTEVYGLSDREDVTGQFAEPGFTGFDGIHGFLRRSSVGKHQPSYVTIDIPIDNTVTVLGGVNKKMQVLVNWFTVDPVTNETGPWHCALYDNGNFSSLDVLGASWTYCLDINNPGAFLIDSSIGNRIYDDGVYYTIQNPVIPAGYTVNVDATGFNDNFELVGRYVATETCGRDFCNRISANFVATPR